MDKIFIIILMSLFIFSPSDKLKAQLENSNFTKQDYPVFQLVQKVVPRKSYDLGNCYQYSLCRGDSIGNMWVHAPKFCATLGGKSWMNENQQCFELVPGPYGTE